MKYINQIEPLFGKEEAEALREYILSGGWGTEFKETVKFEKMICEFTGAKHCSAVNNGTMALVIALLAVGIKPGDEVLIPALTMVATANAVRFIGAKPVLVDVDDTLCMDTDVGLTLNYISQKTKAIIYVSLNGRSGDIERLAKECKNKGIFLIEDACQSLGSSHNEKSLGTFGDIGCYSLSPHKLISTGQGGLIVTDNDKLSDNVRRLKDFGRLKGGADVHTHFGINSKFTDFQAVIGIEQMKKIEERIMRKRILYYKYLSALIDIVGIDFISTDIIYGTPWFMDIYVEDRTKLQSYLRDNNIGTRPVYPLICDQPIYKELADDFPVARKYSDRGLWLPSSISLDNKEVEYICEKIKDFYQKGKE